MGLKCLVVINLYNPCRKLVVNRKIEAESYGVEI